VSNNPLPSRVLPVFALALGAVSAAPAPGVACGRTSDCLTGGRTFRIAAPEDVSASPPKGAVIFAHGYRGSAAGVMSNDALVALAAESNIVLVAVNGVGGSWNLPNAPGGKDADGPDEIAYFDALSGWLRETYGIGPERSVVAGFSSGGMLVWNIACDRGETYAGFAPVSGTFWQPVPKACPTLPDHLMHFHGTEDPVVPMEGRPIGDARQGDVHKAIDMVLAMSDYGPPATTADGDLACERWIDGAAHDLELCTFPGGHQYRPEFVARALDAFLPDN
jgi:polyhydroxybutyrate depolymerase